LLTIAREIYKGRIVEKGSFEQLYNTPDSIFKKMCTEQQLTNLEI